MPRLTEEQKKQCAAAKAMRHALEAEKCDRCESMKRLEWEKNGTYLTRAEFEANVPCRGCGRPFIDNRGPWPAAEIHMTPAEVEEYAAENMYYLDTHRDCHACRTGIYGSRITPLRVLLSASAAQRQENRSHPTRVWEGIEDPRSRTRYLEVDAHMWTHRRG